MPTKVTDTERFIITYSPGSEFKTSAVAEFSDEETARERLLVYRLTAQGRGNYAVVRVATTTVEHVVTTLTDW